MARREHKLTKAPTNGIAIVLPEPFQYYYPNRDNEDDEASTDTPNLQPDHSEKAKATDRLGVAKKTDVLCILPQWPGRLLRKRKRGVRASKSTDSDSIRLLDESSDRGKWVLI